MKSWDEMSDEERVAWYERFGEGMTTAEAAALARGILQNPETLAEARRLLAEHDAAQSTPNSVPDAPQPPEVPDPPPPVKPKKKRKS
ncbi:hypothetical protein R5W23_005878 [Gemmata sp. JC673]|uniref:DUF3606 domain-containing protein n=1 Tax=Gemmata algarum TaxID=2975278 RepID=A0ABU5EUC3_9BACT|nr:hypothetical protein [Gemmata algarum]MDY3558721.1 hypothetical protein [Gemmata algarum]